MSDNPYTNDNFNNNDSVNPKPDFTPDEYYQQSFGKEEPAVDSYGSTSYDAPVSEHKEPEQSAYSTQNIYSSTSYNKGYTSYPNYSNQYEQQPYAVPQQKPKKKKEKKPVTKGSLVAILVISILCSSVLGAFGGYYAARQNSNGLTINKSDGQGTSYVATGAKYTTKEIVDKVADTVVEITTEAVVTGSFSQQYIQQGAGSGVVISSDGYIITNYHVIEDASEITVTLRDQTAYTNVKVVGVYEDGDLALLKVSPKSELKAATLGNSDNLNVGDYAVAIGNPLGQLGGTVTDGIISALDRKVTIDNETMNLLQTNAEISPGNSGGGLFDGNGELIGIVNAKNASETAEGLGFAIPVNDVVDVLSDLKEYGYVKGQIDLGMSLSDISSTAQAWMYGTNQTGVYVTSVNNGSNAAKAGFNAGDIITEVNGKKVESTAELNEIIHKLKVGDEVSFKVYRGRQSGTLKMILEEYTLSISSDSDNKNNDNNNSFDSPWDIFGY